MTGLRRRMFEELRLRNYSPNTIEVYLRCIANFAHYFRVSPDRLGPEHIREYQLFLVERKKVSWALFNQTVCALRFFYHHTLHRDWMIEHIDFVNPAWPSNDTLIRPTSRVSGSGFFRRQL
jgi:integrase/recombinase XerD